jgi:CheY-like chemotaxis protein
VDGSGNRQTGGQHPTILLVDDDDAVREITGVLLGRLGYRILQAARATAALALLDAEPAVDLLLTDITMPGGMNGIELAQAARRRRPALRVLFTTGDPAAVRSGPVLQKPYRFEGLVSALEAALE